MANPPAFQLYASDFYMDTASWSPNDIGIYFRLLIYEWINGPIPDDLRKMARIAGCDPKTLDKSWHLCIGEKFYKKGSGTREISRPMYTGKIPDTNGVTGWENSRLEKTRKEQQEHREKLVNSGRLGGLKTQNIARKESSEASSEASSENKALQSSSSSSSSKKNKPPLPPKGYTVDFENFWKEYPKKIGKGDAFKSWNKNGQPTLEIILKAIRAQRESDQWKKEGGQFIPLPSTWLNQKRWDDEPFKKRSYWDE